MSGRARGARGRGWSAGAMGRSETIKGRGLVRLPRAAPCAPPRGPHHHPGRAPADLSLPALPFNAVYCASKFALEGLCESPRLAAALRGPVSHRLPPRGPPDPWTLGTSAPHLVGTALRHSPQCGSRWLCARHSSGRLARVLSFHLSTLLVRRRYWAAQARGSGLTQGHTVG